jgi:type I restriction enzyme S subunit
MNTVASPQILSVKDAPGRARQLIQEGDTVFSTVRPYMKNIAYINESLDGEIASTGFCVIRANTEFVTKGFIKFFSSSDNLLEQILPLQRGVSYPAVRDKDLFSASVLVPPLIEQQKIVDILEEQLSRLDAALASIRSVRSKAARFRRSLLQSAFTGALTGHDSSPGTLPNDWRLLKIADFASVKGGKRLPKGTQWSQVETNHPYIRATDIKNGRINEENLVYVPEKIWPTISRYIVATNDVIITIAGTIGSVAVVPEKLNGANLTENAAKICDLHDVLARFLLFYLMSPETQTVISGLSTSTTQAKLALFRIETIEVPTPSLREQQKIVEIVDTQISILDQSLSLVDAIERKASALRRSLLHAAFTGELTKEWRERAHV